jgi:hypothetical protein
VAVRVFDAGDDSVGIFIVLGDLNPAKLPPKHDFEVDWDQIQGGKYNWIIDVLQLVDLILDPIGALVLERSILTDRYDAPVAASPLDFQNVAGPMPISQVDQWVGFSEDDDQPFPIYGWMNVYWEERQIVAEP